MIPMGPDPDPYYGKGTFVGHGTIDGQAVKVSGEAGTANPDINDGMPFRIGTVMGWPTPTP